MNVVDLVVLAVLALNALLGAVRGFAKQSLKIAGVVVGLWAALAYYEPAGELLRDVLGLTGWGTTALAAFGFIAIGLAVYGAALLLGHLAREGLEKARLGGADRFLGLLFGGVKGALFCAVGLHFVAPVADHLPAAVRSEFMSESGEPASRAYALYTEYLKADAGKLQTRVVERTKSGDSGK